MMDAKLFGEHTWDITYDSGAVLGSFWGTHAQAIDYAERNFPGFSELRMQPDSFDGKEDGSCCCTNCTCRETDNMTRSDISFHPFLARHTPESRFTHWTLTEAEVLDRVHKNWNNRRPGYRTGVLEVPVDPEGFFSPVVFLKAGDRLRGVYESRVEGEEPRMVTVLDRGSREKTPAVGVNVILYHKDVLAEDGETFDHDWAIISANARVTDEPEPMTVGTLMANHFHIDGGTATGWSPEKFEEELRKSFLYWRDKAFLG